MALYTLGINHRAPVELREKFAFTGEQLKQDLQRLKQIPAVNEAVLLSTCNRTEIYTVTPDREPLLQWLSQHHALDFSQFMHFSYFYEEQESIRHLLRVASGLDSVVLGEPQILGQMKQAYQIAEEMGVVGNYFKRLFPSVFSVAKHIRSKTDIGKLPVSMAYAVMQMGKQIFSHIEDCQVLLIGAGESIELVATYLHRQGVKKLTVANRTVEKARQLAELFQGRAIRIADVPACLQESDIVVTATASQLPILGKGLLETVIKKRKHRPLLMIDLAVPRDIEPEVAELEDIYLYNIDSLKNIIEQNLKSREEVAIQVEAMIELEAEHTMQQLRVYNTADMISSYRRQIEKMRDEALAKALDRLRKGEKTEVVLSMLAYTLSNKWMHHPTLKIREAAYEGDAERLTLLKNLLKIEL